METINNVIKKIKAILGFHGVSDSDVLKACNTAYSGLLNNTAYPNPPVPLPVFRQALDSFNALIVDAEDGGKKSISAKDKQRRAVIKMYESLGHYVEGACNDDPRSEEHTSELQSRFDLVCRLLLEKKKEQSTNNT